MNYNGYSGAWGKGQNPHTRFGTPKLCFSEKELAYAGVEDVGHVTASKYFSALATRDGACHPPYPCN